MEKLALLSNEIDRVTSMLRLKDQEIDQLRQKCRDFDEIRNKSKLLEIKLLES